MLTITLPSPYHHGNAISPAAYWPAAGRAVMLTINITLPLLYHHGNASSPAAYWPAAGKAVMLTITITLPLWECQPSSYHFLCSSNYNSMLSYFECSLIRTYPLSIFSCFTICKVTIVHIYLLHISYLSYIGFF